MMRTVLLDLDDTLFDHRGCSRDALEAVRQGDASLGALPLEELERQHAAVLEDLHREVMLGRMPLDLARRERFRRLLAGSGGAASDAAAAAAAEAYRVRYREVRRAVRGAVHFLEALRVRARIGVVSNNLYDEQQDKLRVCGLDTFIDALVVSERAGVSKPDPGIFRMALEALDATPDRTVMVGDSWTADIAGARAAGLHAVWFNPLRLPVPAGEVPVAELHTLKPAGAAVRRILSPQLETASPG
ncbi:MAG: HAD-IA family hydrolase [Acidobacteriota bacterium]